MIVGLGVFFLLAPSYHGDNGGEAQTPRDRAARRKKLKKRLAVTGSKVVRRTD